MNYFTLKMYYIFVGTSTKESKIVTFSKEDMTHLFWTCCPSHCLAALDLGAGVEQPFDWLIVQNSQAMQSTGRWMDWTLEDNMVAGHSSAPHSQTAEEAIPHLYKREGKRPIPVQKRWSRTQAPLGRFMPGYKCRCFGKNAEYCGVVRPLRIPLVIRP